MRLLLTAAVVLSSLVGATHARASAAYRAMLAPTRAGCGVVHLGRAGTIDTRPAFASGTAGSQVVYIRQLDHPEPIDVLAYRIASIRARSHPAEVTQLGADAGMTFPAGRYKICVFTDQPRTLAIVARGLTRNVSVRLTGVHATFRQLQGTPSGGLPFWTETAIGRVRTTSSAGLILAAGVVDLDPAPVATYDSTICFERAGATCGRSALYGTGDVQVTPGRGSQVDGEYWAQGEAGPGTFDVGLSYRGTRRPARLHAIVLWSDL